MMNALIKHLIDVIDSSSLAIYNNLLLVLLVYNYYYWSILTLDSPKQSIQKLTV